MPGALEVVALALGEAVVVEVGPPEEQVTALVAERADRQVLGPPTHAGHDVELGADAVAGLAVHPVVRPEVAAVLRAAGVHDADRVHDALAERVEVAEVDAVVDRQLQGLGDEQPVDVGVGQLRAAHLEGPDHVVGEVQATGRHGLEVLRDRARVAVRPVVRAVEQRGDVRLGHRARRVGEGDQDGQSAHGPVVQHPPREQPARGAEGEQGLALARRRLDRQHPVEVVAHPLVAQLPRRVLVPGQARGRRFVGRDARGGEAPRRGGGVAEPPDVLVVHDREAVERLVAGEHVVPEDHQPDRLTGGLREGQGLSEDRTHDTPDCPAARPPRQ